MVKKIAKQENETKLQKDVRNIINQYGKDYDDTGIEGFLKDLFYGGCQSGIVGELIYYNDTCKFYEKHKKDISDLLKDTLSNYMEKSTRLDIFGDKWDIMDPLCLDGENQNLLAWFAFEETSRQFADSLNIEV